MARTPMRHAYVSSVSDSVALSESLSTEQAMAMAWDLRSVPLSRIRRIVVPTEPVVTRDGTFVLRPSVPLIPLLDC